MVARKGRTSTARARLGIGVVQVRQRLERVDGQQDLGNVGVDLVLTEARARGVQQRCVVEHLQITVIADIGVGAAALEYLFALPCARPQPRLHRHLRVGRE